MIFLKRHMFFFLLLLSCVPYITSSKKGRDFINEFKSQKKSRTVNPLFQPKSPLKKPAISTSLQRVSKEILSYFEGVARYAYLAYCRKFEESISPKIPIAQEKFRDEFEVISVVNNPNTTTIGFIAINKVMKNIIVSFRGTKKRSINNWLTNIQVQLVSSRPIGPDYVRIHGGFKKAYMPVRRMILNTLEDVYEKNPNCSITFTGHSLGGALATLAALDVTFNTAIKKDVLHLVTYGQPRTGGKSLAEYLSASTLNKVVRIVSKADIVPHVPPRFMGYRHHGSELWYVNDDLLICSKREAEDCSLSLKPTSLTVKDHFVYLGVKKDEVKCEHLFYESKPIIFGSYRTLKPTR